MSINWIFQNVLRFICFIKFSTPIWRFNSIFDLKILDFVILTVLLTALVHVFWLFRSLRKYPSHELPVFRWLGMKSINGIIYWELTICIYRIIKIQKNFSKSWSIFRVGNTIGQLIRIETFIIRNYIL